MKKKYNEGENNGMWRGDKAKYRAIQAWIQNNYGKANKCENNFEHRGLFVWKSISGKCLRDREDYKMVCQSCNLKESHDKIREKKEYKDMKKEVLPLLKKEVPIRKISRLTGITRHKIKSIAKREGYKTDFRKKKSILKNGYYYIWINGKYFMEHRIIVENHIGRKLLKKERVHHLDENKQNNKIENLMLFKNDSEHIKFHNKIRQFGMTNPIKRQIKNRWKQLV